MKRLGWLLGALGALSLFGCAQQQRSAETSGVVRPIVGPDGSQLLHISCGADEGRCYQLAGERCPAGYDVGRTHSGERGQLFVRCRPPAPYGSAWSVRGGPEPAPPPIAP
ncbi:MAG: hypothetical protein KIT72_13030 [Polyangiaceae bacterium]|nr:hypothetical protein [Polyangiaceae bacterium]MCW5791334.1 hypothetical protein [Polyangiaceae bacterium]